MKLTRLRLLGFKSFVEPTDFLIEPGLTGVVGPNGCGKSNLVEALRWVMGETSHKAMRAADMDSVIFNGSGNRPARNHAEVAMAIDNTDRTAPAQFNDTENLEVTRRIERDNGSTYRINGREVRARDVHILFADASTGSRSPALVHQGRIGEIIQAKPEQRRRVLEEAAGISGLHARRHEAELRLRAAESNLQRLEDVIGQLAGQVEGLKRQARQAVRYRAVSSQVRQAEATLFHLRWIAAHAEVGEAVQAKDLSVREVATRTGAQAEAATKQALLAADLPALREAEAGAAAGLHRLVIARETLEREEARARERMAELDRYLVQLTADVERERKLAADAEAALARLSAEQETLGGEAEAGASRRIEAEARVAEADTALSASEKTFGELTGALADLTARRNQLGNTIRGHNERFAKLQRELTEVTVELEKLEGPTEGRPDLEVLAAEVEHAQAAIGEAEAAGVRAEAAQSAARQALDVAREPLAEAERRAQRLDTEAKTLSKLLHVDSKHMFPAVIEDLQVEKGYEQALGAALGDDLEAPVDPSAPMRWAGAAIDPNDPALPEGTESLAAHVRAPQELARRLVQIGVIARQDAPRLVPLLKPGQRLVSREGDVWRWDGFSAAANAPTGAARRLAGKNRLADIEHELQSVRLEVEAKRELVSAAEDEVEASAEAQTAARASQRERQHEANALRERFAQAERETARIAARLSALAEGQTRLADSLQEAAASREESEAALAELPEPSKLEGELFEVRQTVGERRSKLAELRAEAQAIAREAELAQRRLQAIAAEQTDWTARRDGAQVQIGNLEVRVEATRNERAGLDDAPQQFADKRQSLIGEIERAEGDRRAAADRLQESENALAAADREARAALEAMSTAREDAVRAEERHQAADRRLHDLAHEIQEILEVEPNALVNLAGLDPAEGLPDIVEVDERLDKLRRERERLGAVNLRAEEELKEVETQHSALTTERDDLVEAIKRLRQGIQNLNKEARERLLASFEVVNTHFKELFTHLFNGGTAELQLVESDDPLEAGLEIIAKPPGKKPSTLSLLSGGEQALTALALIFAVFLTNPAPICVLDEVDAPLDDHNVERFCDLLDEMAKSTDTRFVIITHNPITMARMNRLFGVTMAERGVSQLVSVDLAEAVKFKQAV
ncbi:MAG: chromosome segregation protein [Xanthobacteraceae bacterium]|jgi:chromosome segregation protein|nr:chromosome segregation protein [Xanthobacteraceae bacterium]